MKRKWLTRALAAILAGTFAFASVGADSCKTSNEKLQRDSKELEEGLHKYEKERGCEDKPPYNCPKEP